MITCIINILMLCFLWPISPDSQDIQQNGLQHTDIQGVIKIAKYATWPNENNMITITITIAPKSDESFNAAENSAADSKIRGLSIHLKYASETYTDETTEQTNIIFIEKGTNIDIDKTIKKVRDQQILTATNDFEILEKGCMFYIKTNPETGQLTYYYNKEAILASKLNISARILTPDHRYEKQ